MTQRMIGLVLLGLGVSAMLAFAQAPDCKFGAEAPSRLAWTTGKLCWHWEGPADPAATGFEARCKRPGEPSFGWKKALPLVQMEVSIREFVPNPGQIECEVAVLYATGEGGVSNRYPFGFSVNLLLGGQ